MPVEQPVSDRSALQEELGAGAVVAAPVTAAAILAQAWAATQGLAKQPSHLEASEAGTGSPEPVSEVLEVTEPTEVLDTTAAQPGPEVRVEEVEGVEEEVQAV